MGAVPVSVFNGNFPFNDPVWLDMWMAAPDTRTLAMLNSGIMVDDAVLTQKISGGGYDLVSPFMNVLGGPTANYDGNTDIPVEGVSASFSRGVVYGRSQAWTERDFAADISGSDPEGHVAASLAKFWNGQKHTILIQMLNGLFSATSADPLTTQFTDMHTLETGLPVSVTDFNRLATRALGDNRNVFRAIVMHSHVASVLEDLNLIDFDKYTRPDAFAHGGRIGSLRGWLVIEDDGVPVNGDEYHSYLIGNGVIRRANAPVSNPAHLGYEALTNGGEWTLSTKIREGILINGAQYTSPAGASESPTNDELADGANWRISYSPKAIPLARLITTEDWS